MRVRGATGGDAMDELWFASGRPDRLRIRWMWWWWCLVSASVAASVAASGAIVTTFSEPNGQRLQHLVVDKHSALVYVGGVNRLYQLSPDLERHVTVETGPRDDSPNCPAVDCLDSVDKQKTDNFNKALVIDYTDTRLIACGTLFQGVYHSHASHIHSTHIICITSTLALKQRVRNKYICVKRTLGQPRLTHVLYRYEMAVHSAA